MGKVLILYHSATGNTPKMARFVAQGADSIPSIEVRLRDVESVTADDVLWCDGLAVGSPTNMGILSWKMKRFWDEVMGPHWMKVDGKIVHGHLGPAAMPVRLFGIWPVPDMPAVLSHAGCDP